MKLIKDIIIDSSNIRKEGDIRDFFVIGDVGSRFTLRIKNETPHYYNFDTKSFQSSQTSDTELKSIELKNTNVYRGSIVFPSISDDDYYVIELFAEPPYDTFLDSTSLTKGDNTSISKLYYSKTIYQYTNPRLTLAINTSTTGEFQSMPDSVYVDAAPGQPVAFAKDFSWTVKSVDAIAGGALKLDRQPRDSDFEISQTQTVDGVISSSTTVVLDDLGDIFTGMTVSGSGISSPPTVTAIDTSTKTVTMSAAQSISDGVTLTFTAGGYNNIKRFVDAGVQFNDVNAKLTEFTTTINQPTWDGTQSATDDIIVTSVHGILADGTATVSGIGINKEAGEQYVTAITYGSDAITITTAQQLKHGAILTIGGSAQECVIKGNMTISKMPTSNLTITLNVDNILTSNPT
jgi:hypothetical protein